MRWVVPSSLFVSVCLLGCGGTTVPAEGTDATTDTGGASGDGATGDTSALADAPRVDAGNFCTDAAARAARCGKSFDPGKCAKQAACYGAVLKPDDGALVMGCMSTADCATSDDSCLIAPSAKYASDPTTQAYSKACFDKRAACKDPTTGSIPFADDLCGIYHGMINATYLAQAKACFDKPCAEVKGCYDGVFKAAGCN